jgi:hypothetical protein
MVTSMAKANRLRRLSPAQTVGPCRSRLFFKLFQSHGLRGLTPPRNLRGKVSGAKKSCGVGYRV